MDRQMYGEHTQDRQRQTETERWREGPQLTVCLSLQLIDRSQSQSQSRQSDRKQNRLLCLPACPMWKMIPAVKRSTYRPGHLAMLSYSLSHCPTVPLPVVCRLSCRVIARRCCYYCCCLTFQWFFQLERKEKCGLRTKTIVAKSTALLKEKERERQGRGPVESDRQRS